MLFRSQGGHHHVNEQPKEFWIDTLKEYGFKYLPEDSEEISNTNESDLVRKNSMFFINENFEAETTKEMPFVISKELVDESLSLFVKHGGKYE